MCVGRVLATQPLHRCTAQQPGFRMELHTMGSRRPLPKFMFWEALLMWITSTVLLCQNPSALLWTVAPYQLIQWLAFWTWTAMPFLGFPLLTACLCSFSLTFSVLLIPPTSNPYKESHTPLLSVFVLGSLSSPASVLFSDSSFGLKTGFTPNWAQTF